MRQSKWHKPQIMSLHTRCPRPVWWVMPNRWSSVRATVDGRLQVNPNHWHGEEKMALALFQDQWVAGIARHCKGASFCRYVKKRENPKNGRVQHRPGNSHKRQHMHWIRQCTGGLYSPVSLRHSQQCISEIWEFSELDWNSWARTASQMEDIFLSSKIDDTNYGRKDWNR